MEGPLLVESLLNMDVGSTTLLFSKPLNLSTFYTPSLGFYSDITSSFFFLTSTGSGLQSFGDVVGSSALDSLGVLYFSSEDFVTLKLLNVQRNHIFILLNAAAISDSNGIPIRPYNVSNRFPVDALVTEDQPPVILSTTLDMGGESIFFVLNEPILVRRNYVIFKRQMHSFDFLSCYCTLL